MQRHPRLELFGEDRIRCEAELMNAERILSCITNISINGADLILDRVFDSVGFNKVEDVVFRQLVKARLTYPASKAATVEYLKNHFDEDVSLSKSIAIWTSEVYAAYHNLCTWKEPFVSQNRR